MARPLQSGVPIEAGPALSDARPMIETRRMVEARMPIEAWVLVPPRRVIVESRLTEVGERRAEARQSARLPVEAGVRTGLQIETGVTASGESRLRGAGWHRRGCAEIGLVACTEMRVPV